MAFQIVDDIQDEAQDLHNKRQANFACLFGRKKALEMFQHEITQYQHQIESLQINNDELIGLSKLLVEQANAS